MKIRLSFPDPCSSHSLRAASGTLPGALFVLAILLFMAAGGSANPAQPSESPAQIDTSVAPLGGVHPQRVRFDPSIRFVQSRRQDPVIDTVIIIGNKVTDRFVILTEIELDSGDVATDEAMRQDIQRLESLKLFGRAEMKLGAMSGNRTALVVEVTELWYIWPGIYFAVDEDDPTRTTVGGFVTHENFRGQRERLSISARYGYITGFSFNWNIPYVSPSNPQWSLNVKGGFTDEEEPKFLTNREGVISRERSLESQVGYRFNLEDYTWLKLTARSRAFDSDNPLHESLTLSETGQDIVGEFQTGFERDTRKYDPWPEDSFITRAMITTGIGLNHTGSSYLKPELYGAIYRSPWPRVHLASRLKLESFVGSTPLYARLLLDRQNGLRTAMTKKYQGTWRILSTAEVRNDLLPVRYLTFKIWDPINQYTRNLKFGVSSAVFLDYGVVGGVDEPAPYSETDETAGWDAAYGVGLILHVPYRDLVRLELMRSARFPSDGFLFRLRIGSWF